MGGTEGRKNTAKVIVILWWKVIKAGNKGSGIGDGEKWTNLQAIQTVDSRRTEWLFEGGEVGSGKLGVQNGFVSSLREWSTQEEQWGWCDGEERFPFWVVMKQSPLTVLTSECFSFWGYREPSLHGEGGNVALRRLHNTGPSVSYFGRKTFLRQTAVIQNVDISTCDSRF